MFLTQDTEFGDLTDLSAIVVISRVPQRLPIKERVELWFEALTEFLDRQPGIDVYEFLETATIVPRD